MKQLPKYRPLRFYWLTAAWFALIGPGFVLPFFAESPPLIALSYLVGVIPAFVSGGVFALRYRNKPVPAHWFRRMLAGAQVGGAVAACCTLAFYLGLYRLLPRSYQPAMGPFDMEFLAFLVAAVAMFGLFGALGGALAASFMLSRLRLQHRNDASRDASSQAHPPATSRPPQS